MRFRSMWVSGVLYVKWTQTWSDKESIGLYEDNGLGVFHKIPKPEIERKKNQTLKRIKECGLSIIFQRNLKSVTFLDVTYDLHNDLCKP